jgi:hypothetical protein
MKSDANARAGDVLPLTSLVVAVACVLLAKIGLAVSIERIALGARRPLIAIESLLHASSREQERCRGDDEPCKVAGERYRGHDEAYPRRSLAYTRRSLAFPRHSLAFPCHSLAFPPHSLAFPPHSLAFPRHSLAFSPHSLAFPRHCAACSRLSNGAPAPLRGAGASPRCRSA